MDQGIYIDARLAKTITRREPLDDEQPGGYLISDREWMEQNAGICIAVLEKLSKRWHTDPEHSTGPTSLEVGPVVRSVTDWNGG